MMGLTYRLAIVNPETGQQVICGVLKRLNVQPDYDIGVPCPESGRLAWVTNPELRATVTIEYESFELGPEFSAITAATRERYVRDSSNVSRWMTE